MTRLAGKVSDLAHNQAQVSSILTAATRKGKA